MGKRTVNLHALKIIFKEKAKEENPSTLLITQ
jgi:hypothetical protein